MFKCEKKFIALFVRRDSSYKLRMSWDCYDIDRGAKTYNGNDPVVCHPPCRAWGQLSHMAKPRLDEKELALWSIDTVRERGGILEHPHGSKLFKHKYNGGEHRLPLIGEYDNFGGFVIEIDQFDFGHVASKPTKLYIVGCSKQQLPSLPSRRLETPKKSISGTYAMKGITLRKRCTQYEREYTPSKLIDWFEDVLTIIQQNNECNYVYHCGYQTEVEEVS